MNLVRTKQVYKHKSPESHFRAVRMDVLRLMCPSHEVDMAALENYSKILLWCDHTVRVIVIDAVEMKKQGLKAGCHILAQCKKSGHISADSVLQEDTVDISDIRNSEQYYRGLAFVPSLSTRHVQTGRLTVVADAAHC